MYRHFKTVPNIFTLLFVNETIFQLSLWVFSYFLNFTSRPRALSSGECLGSSHTCFLFAFALLVSIFLCSTVRYKKINTKKMSLVKHLKITSTRAFYSNSHFKSSIKSLKNHFKLYESRSWVVETLQSNDTF